MQPVRGLHSRSGDVTGSRPTAGKTKGRRFSRWCVADAPTQLSHAPSWPTATHCRKPPRGLWRDRREGGGRERCGACCDAAWTRSPGDGGEAFSSWAAVRPRQSSTELMQSGWSHLGFSCNRAPHSRLVRRLQLPPMCFKTVCPTCSKATWAGCGAHIEGALRGVPIPERCAGWRTGKCPGPSGGASAPKASKRRSARDAGEH